MTWIAANASISLIVPPSISGSELPSEIGVLSNESIQLVCRAQGTPTPSIRWLKDGEAMDNMGNGRLRYSETPTKKIFKKETSTDVMMM